MKIVGFLAEDLKACKVKTWIPERSWLLKGLWCTSRRQLWVQKVRLYDSLAFRTWYPGLLCAIKRWFCALTLPTCTVCSSPSRYAWREKRCVKSTRRGSGFSKRQRWGCLHVATVPGLLTVYDDLNVPEKRTAFDWSLGDIVKTKSVHTSYTRGQNIV